ncbi:MAG: hypothetical protein M5U14_09660 [Acidimicrobiia bacterium]|nr:hypothetical protein [Acidimicrobiia bacterium]
MSRRLDDTRAWLAEWRAERDADRASRLPGLADPSPDETTDVIERSARRVPDEFLADAHAAVERVARRHERLTVDDVRDELERAGQHDGYDLRALGAVLQRAARRGLIESTDRYAPSRRRHSSPLRVWRSRLYRAEEAS